MMRIREQNSMPKKKSGILDYLDEIAFEILKLMKDAEKRYSDLQKESPVSSGAFSTRINQLIELGLVKIRYDLTERRPLYMLTPTGKRILELLEEIKQVYKEGVSLDEKEIKEIEEMMNKSESGEYGINC